MIPKLKILQFIVPVFLAVILITSPLMAQDLWPYQDETSGKWGYMNGNNETVIECMYDHAGEFIHSDGIARVKLNDIYAYINTKGKLVTEWLEEAPLYIEEHEIIRKGNTYNVIWFDGDLMFKEWYDCFIWGYAGDGPYELPYIFLHENTWQIAGYGSKRNEVKFENIYGWSDDWKLMAKRSGRWICIDEGYNELKKGFREVYEFENDLSLQYKCGKYGFINDRGEVFIPHQYDFAEQFSEGMAVVGEIDTYDLLDDSPYYHYGYINTGGELVIPYQFTSASGFSKGCAKVSTGAQTFFIDNKGNHVDCPSE